MQAQEEMTAVRLEDFVDGQWVDSSASATHRVENPATGEILAQCPLGGEAEVGMMDRRGTRGRSTRGFWCCVGFRRHGTVPVGRRLLARREPAGMRARPRRGKPRSDRAR